MIGLGLGSLERSVSQGPVTRRDEIEHCTAIWGLHTDTFLFFLFFFIEFYLPCLTFQIEKFVFQCKTALMNM